MKTLAIIPAYNEEESLAATIEELERVAPEVDYVVINDGSSDGTRDLCRARGFDYIDLPVNVGLSAGFQTGMKYAKERGYDYAIQFDADGPHSAAYISEMLERAEETGADVVIGSRFANCKKPFSPRMVGSALITAMILLTTRKKVQDPTSGMRLFNARLIPLFADELDYGPEPDTISYLMRNGFKVEEVQVEMRERTAGESYLNFTKSVSYMLRMSISILLVQWFRRKIR